MQFEQFSTYDTRLKSVWYSDVGNGSYSEYVITESIKGIFCLYRKYQNPLNLLGNFPTLEKAIKFAEEHKLTSLNECKLIMLGSDKAQVFLNGDFSYSLNRIKFKVNKGTFWKMYSKKGFICNSFYSIEQVRKHFERRGFSIV